MEENPEKEDELRKATNAKRRSQRAASKALERVQKLAEVAGKVQNNMRTCIVKISDNLTSKSMRLAEEKRLAETAKLRNDYNDDEDDDNESHDDGSEASADVGNDPGSDDDSNSDEIDCDSDCSIDSYIEPEYLKNDISHTLYRNQTAVPTAAQLKNFELVGRILPAEMLFWENSGLGLHEDFEAIPEILRDKKSNDETVVALASSRLELVKTSLREQIVTPKDIAPIIKNFNKPY